MQKSAQSIKTSRYQVSYEIFSPDCWRHFFLKAPAQPSHGVILFPRTAVLGKILVRSGCVRLKSDGEPIEIRQNFVFFSPISGLVIWDLDPGRYEIDILTFRYEPHPGSPQVPSFSLSFGEIPTDINHAMQRIASHRGFAPITHSATPSRLACRLKVFLDRNFEREISVTRLASEFGTSREVLTRNFTRAFGISPSHYRIYSRVYYALNLISVKKKDITDALFEVGFGDYANFYRQFTEVIGCSPSLYKGLLPVHLPNPSLVASGKKSVFGNYSNSPKQ